jgi:hypothetical protein
MARLPAPIHLLPARGARTNLEVIAMSRSRLIRGARRRTAEIAVATSVTLLPSLAAAHFSLQSPPNWTAEDNLGSPQKDWPCGDEGNPTATGPTTAFKAGDKVTIKLTETVTHGGYYRVAIATSGDPNDLPQDMSMDASGGNCQTDDKQATPTFPILADGELQHTQSQPLSGVQSFDITLPTDISCDKCVLQVREYMTPHSNQAETTSGQAAHMNGCYYHHCAYISVSGGSGAGGMSGGGGAASAGAPNSSGGVPGLGGMGGMSMGGSMGEAGTLAMSGGGMPGAGGGSGAGRSGAGAAGMTGTGGGPTGTGGSSSSSGGSTTTGGSTSSGGSTTTGGTGTGTGGTTGGGPAASGSGGSHSAPATNGNDNSSGGCSIATRRGSAPFALAGMLGAWLWFARRRRS